MLQSIYRLFIELTNGRITSGLLRRFSQSKWSRPFIPLYTKAYRLNIGESMKQIGAYETLHDLFTRQLKEGARPITEDALAVASPVDGVLEDVGEIQPEKQIIVKDKVYSMTEMFADEPTLEKYLGGRYAVLYLSPSHYHRIHAPVTGSVLKRWTLGKKSFPVNRWGMKYGKAPLSKNYRTITEMETVNGHVAIAKVGAMFVNSIVITDSSNELKIGQEFSYFSFGSTVVLFFEKGCFEMETSLSVPADVHVGQKIGTLSRLSG
ncbi:phosphatidylserine decarboxylase [Bacillus massiliglaciei]|uniref:phosphatidylserine decarboxylase n=1 Tax=Bacillus massiliglaciei TaxID=1816693 RepID=UPI000A7BAD79|nr:phosphatidylserine decarboxylase [Bacillus massiliglaciei]